MSYDGLIIKSLKTSSPVESDWVWTWFRSCRWILSCGNFLKFGGAWHSWVRAIVFHVNSSTLEVCIFLWNATNYPISLGATKKVRQVYSPQWKTGWFKRVGWLNIPCRSSDLCCMDYQDIWPALFLGPERVGTLADPTHTKFESRTGDGVSGNL